MVRKTQAGSEFMGAGTTAVAEAPAKTVEAVKNLAQTADPTPTAAEAPIGPEEVFNAMQAYHPNDVDYRLGFSDGKTAAAVRNHAFPCVRGDNTIDGDLIVGWVRREKIAVNIPAEIQAGVRRLRAYRAEQAAPMPTRPMDAIDTALATAGQWKAAEAACEAQESQAALDRIQDLVVRTALDNRQISQLANDAAFLGLDEAKLRGIKDAIARAEELTRFHTDLANANDQVREAREAITAIQKRHAEELDAAWKLKRRADGYATTCHGAGWELVLLSRKWPGLFDTTVEPPTLRVVAGEGEA